MTVLFVAYSDKFVMVEGKKLIEVKNGSTRELEELPNEPFKKVIGKRGCIA